MQMAQAVAHSKQVQQEERKKRGHVGQEQLVRMQAAQAMAHLQQVQQKKAFQPAVQ